MADEVKQVLSFGISLEKTKSRTVGHNYPPIIESITHKYICQSFTVTEFCVRCQDSRPRALLIFQDPPGRRTVSGQSNIDITAAVKTQRERERGLEGQGEVKQVDKSHQCSLCENVSSFNE